ncbi:MAG: CPBP family intramembrane glutamic endopeptidase [Anaerolineales bacterium]
MSYQQLIAIVAPPVLIGTMTLVFRYAARRFGDRTGWFVGLVSYWLLWGVAYSFLLVGSTNVLLSMYPKRPDLASLALAGAPVVFAASGRFWFGARYEKNSGLEGVALLVTALGNGFFEEILWRGTYLVLFPSNFIFGIAWPSLCFGAWHYAPVSISNRGNRTRIIRLMVGAVILGIALSLAAFRTGTIFWSIISHTLAGIVLVL